jgi:large subunit ribosomal protein L21
LDVERLSADVGATVELSEVLLIAANGALQVGTPLVDGARIVAEVMEQGRDRKIEVFKYKNKTRYRRRYGHRQPFTRLAIRQIVTGTGQVIEAEEKPKRPARPKRPRKAEPRATAVEATGDVTSAPAPEAVSEVQAAPRTRRAAAAKPRTAARPKAITAPKAAAKPKATTAPKAAARPKATTAPKAAARPKAPAKLRATRAPKAEATADARAPAADARPARAPRAPRTRAAPGPTPAPEESTESGE